MANFNVATMEFRKGLNLMHHENTKISVIGLGYVGLPVAVAFNKRNFEVIGFYHGTKNDKWTEEIKKNFDEFIDLDKLKIGDVESFIRKKNLDIAVYLNGYTSNSKNEIFS